jgi:cyclase
MIRTSRFVTALSVVLAAPVGIAQELGPSAIRTEQVGEGLYVLFGPGAGNMLASIGADGVLLVDDGVPDIVSAYKDTVTGLGGGGIDFVVNTHWHYDHADGNRVLGPEGVAIVAHENSRLALLRDNVINTGTRTIEQPAFAPQARPAVTYDASMRMHFNGDRIDLLHVGPGHTAGDTAVIFPDRNLVHMGDVFLNGGYPFVDADHGGSLIGIVEFCENVLAELEPGATVIPGHGPVADYEALADYAAMLRTINGRLTALIDEGASFEQVVAAAPTVDWDSEKGDPRAFLDRAYASLTR